MVVVTKAPSDIARGTVTYDSDLHCNLNGKALVGDYRQNDLKKLVCYGNVYGFRACVGTSGAIRLWMHDVGPGDAF